MLLCRCLLFAVPGMLEYDSIPGVSSSRLFGGRSKAHADITVKSVTKMVGEFIRKCHKNTSYIGLKFSTRPFVKVLHRLISSCD